MLDRIKTCWQWRDRLAISLRLQGAWRRQAGPLASGPQLLAAHAFNGGTAWLAIDNASVENACITLHREPPRRASHKLFSEDDEAKLLDRNSSTRRDPGRTGNCGTEGWGDIDGRCSAAASFLKRTIESATLRLNSATLPGGGNGGTGLNAKGVLVSEKDESDHLCQPAEA
jgi:hypothetical protein